MDYNSRLEGAAATAVDAHIPRLADYRYRYSSKRVPDLVSGPVHDKSESQYEAVWMSMYAAVDSTQECSHG